MAEGGKGREVGRYICKLVSQIRAGIIHSSVLCVYLNRGRGIAVNLVSVR